MQVTRLYPILIVSLFIFSLFSPMSVVQNVSASQSEQSPTAFLESWRLESNSVNICSSMSKRDLLTFEDLSSCQLDEGYTLQEDPSESHAVDNVGNHYYVFADDNGGMGGSSHYGDGVHIYKFDINGTFVWREDISAGNSCSYDGTSCGILGLHVVQEDEFYLVMSMNNPGTVTFNSQLSLSLSGYNAVTAYHTASGWMWAEAESTSYYNSVKDNRMDESSNLYMMIYDSYSNNYREYSIIAYDSNGGKWNRVLEVDRYADEVILFDTEVSEIHFLINTYNNVRYDSQTTYCPTGSYQNHCMIWMTINSNGVKSAATPIKSASMTPLNIEVVGSTLFVHGASFDDETNSDDQSINLTGIQNCPVAYCSFLSTIDRSATWSGTKIIYDASSSSTVSFSNIGFNNDGSSVLFAYLLNGVPNYIDGDLINQFTSRTVEVSFVSFDSSFTKLWATSLASDDLEGLSFLKSNEEMLYVGISSDEAIVVNSSISVSPSTNSLLAWITLGNGSIVDIEENVIARPIAVLSGGGLLTRQYTSSTEKIQYYAPDLDNDNIGDNDNCPDVFNPSQNDYNLNGMGDACDEDDDSDGIFDGNDDCPLGALAWTSSTLTDHDGDGCKDSLEEDPDDDNDGYSDQKDRCPTGILGVGNDHDADGCKNSEDDDDDDDGVNDGADQCVQGTIDWLSGQVTDHDADGCKDSTEDDDDDNDGVTDVADSCQFGEINWPSNANTDFDGDGCKDGYEDEDDDGDGVLNYEDECEDSIGIVTSNGCPIGDTNNDGSSNNNGTNEGNTQIYYVCPQGGMVVTELSQCPQSNTSDDNNTLAEPQIYYVCPGGSSVVTNLSLCPESEQNTGPQNITYVLDSDSNLSDDFIVCPKGTAIVMDANDCPSSSGTQSNDEQQSISTSSDPMLMIFAGGAFLMAMIAVLLSLFRRPAPVHHHEQNRFDETDLMFKRQPEIPLDFAQNPPPITSKGTSKNGYEWIEWPIDSGNHWYRLDGASSDWSKYQE